MKRPGYYVEGRYYRDNFHQARARAAHLAREYGRGIEVLLVGPIVGACAPHVVCTIFNGRKEAA